MTLGSYRSSADAHLEVMRWFEEQPERRDPSQRDTEFQAVEGGNETMSGPALLVEAYAALWVILFGFVLVSWRRQARLDARITELERALSSRGATK